MPFPAATLPTRFSGWGFSLSTKPANDRFKIMITRFAPSPTGRMHLGHALSAWIAHDLARSTGGKFLLRMEDIDVSRARPEFEAGIIEDLQWLGLSWDGEILRQSERQEAYQSAFWRLRELDLLYPCFCTRKEIQAEIEAMGGAPHNHGEAIYPGICKRLSPDEREQRIEAGKSHAWRLDSNRASDMAGPLHIEDDLHGKLKVDPELLGDVVITRKDIGVSYHLAVVVDDAHQQITLVSRGDDLLPSTHVHRLLQQTLKLPEPRYHHHALMLDDKGERLAKRSDSLSIAALRKSGKSPSQLLEEIRSFAAR